MEQFRSFSKFSEQQSYFTIVKNKLLIEVAES